MCVCARAYFGDVKFDLQDKEFSVEQNECSTKEHKTQLTRMKLSHSKRQNTPHSIQYAPKLVLDAKLNGETKKLKPLQNPFQIGNECFDLDVMSFLIIKFQVEKTGCKFFQNLNYNCI